MHVSVHNEQDNTTNTVEFNGATLKDLLEHLKINPQTVLCVRKDTVLLEEEKLANDDVITLLSVISGG